MAAKKRTKRRTKAELEKLKSWAKILITKEGHTQVSAAEIVEVSTVTMNKWYNDGKWDELGKKIIYTREETLIRRWAEVEEFDAYILTKAEGSRFADSKEADARTKMMKDIKQLEEEASVGEIISSCKSLLEFTRKVNLKDAQLLEKYADAFIRSKL